MMQFPLAPLYPLGGGSHGTRTGLVTGNRRAVQDAGGPFNALGASLFWLRWGYEHDRDRLSRNLDYLASYGVDYVRALAVVGPSGGWEDRLSDPTAPNWEATVRESTDFAYQHGLRVQWTIFGGTDKCPFVGDQMRIVDAMAHIGQEHEEKVFAFEIANESWQNGFGGAEGRERLTRLGERLDTVSAQFVALSAPEDNVVCKMYGGWTGGAATIHFQRDDGDHGWRFVRQPWGWPDEYRAKESYDGPLPGICFNNEPKGPQSSVSETSDPELLQFAMIDTFMSGVGAYVLHCGAGIRGGGAADLARGRAANLYDSPNMDAILSAHQAIRNILPGDLANYDRANAQWESYPISGIDSAIQVGQLVRSHAAMRGNEGWIDALGMQTDLVIGRAKRPLTLTAIDPHSGQAGTVQTCATGDTVRFEGTGGLLFKVQLT